MIYSEKMIGNQLAEWRRAFLPIFMISNREFSWISMGSSINDSFDGQINDG